MPKDPSDPEDIFISFLDNLPAKRRQYLRSRLKRVDYSPGAEIIRQGQSGNFLGIIEDGQVVVKNSHSQPTILTSGQHFGIEMLHHGKPSSHTITAKTNTSVLILERSDWLAPSTSPGPDKTPLSFPKMQKAGWIALISVIVLIISAVTLGPSGIDYANKTIPSWFVEADQPEVAEKYLRFMLRCYPDSAYLYGKLGDVLVVKGNKDEAVEVYQKAINLDAYLPWIHNNLGVLLLQRGQAELAVQHFQSALNLHPQNFEIYRNLGNAYYALGNWKDAAKSYQSALDINFSLSDAKAAWAGLILHQNRFVEARLVWENVLLEDPRNRLALQGLGVISLLEDAPSQALIYFDAAHYVHPDDPSNYLYSGLALEALGKHKEAASAYQQAADIGTEPDLIHLADALQQIVTELE